MEPKSQNYGIINHKMRATYTGIGLGQHSRLETGFLGSYGFLVFFFLIFFFDFFGTLCFFWYLNLR